MSNFVTENVETDSQWHRATALRNRVWTDGPTTPERARNQALAMPDVPHRRALVCRDGIDRAYVTVSQQYWSDVPTLYGFGIMADGDPETIRFSVDWAEAVIAECGGTEASPWSRTDQPELNQELDSRGYEVRQTNPVGMLDLRTFDAGPWLRPDPEGYEILSVATYAERNPETWKHEFWRLEMAIFADVPLPTPFAEVPFEDWLREAEANPIDYDWLLFAVHEGQPVATTQIFPNHVDRTIANTGLTGVRREHRRRGLASVLKGRALARAQEAGFERVYTDNEESNPMYQINLAIGFRPVHAFLNYHRHLVARS